jgi:aryl-alcohol dehydrogenase-like predicted oxidoreductase
VKHRPLGASGIDVSVLSLGSWRTYERIPREQGLAVMKAAREAGIDFLDDARYDDETGIAPMRTGWSEVVFGELFRASGWKRDEVVVANKLWWEFWPEQSAQRELDESLGRMGLDYLDLVYSWLPPEGLGVAGVVHACGELIASGKVRAWGVGNWTAEQIAEAVRVARDEGLPPPCAAQLPYNVVIRDWVENPALDETGVSVVASMALHQGGLTGKYGSGGDGRLAETIDDPDYEPVLRAAADLRRVADERGTTPAVLALAFALAGPGVASVLFGATRPEQVHENVRATDESAPSLGLYE